MKTITNIYSTNEETFVFKMNQIYFIYFKEVNNLLDQKTFPFLFKRTKLMTLLTFPLL